MDVRDRIRQIIEANPELSFAGVSKAAGLSDSAVHKFCTRQVQSMTLGNIEKVAAALGMSLVELLSPDENDRKAEAEVIEIWDHIPLERREQAKDILKTFATGE